MLDEATSNLDVLTEQTICDVVGELQDGQTIVSIAHKLNTIMDADQIVVLDHGKVDSIGTHEELMRLGGLYRRMYEQQSGKGEAAV